MKRLFIGSLLLLSLSTHAQVGAIRDASRQNSSDKSHSSPSGSSGSSTNSRYSGSAAWFVVDMTWQLMNGVVQWQHYRLRKRFANPSVVSLELMAHAAAQPPDYYLLLPRIRGNWGLFSTDFRYNHLMEESIDGLKSFQTLDWQVLQLNLVTTRAVTFRAGTGFMYESFGKEFFSESTLGLALRFKEDLIGGNVEYRVAKDFSMDATPRREFSVYGQYKAFEAGHWRGYWVLGTTFQRYYSQLNIWGVHGGMTFRFQ